MGNRWVRLFKHRMLDEGDAKRVLGPDAIERLTARVAASEQRHSGEIRLCIEAGLPLSYLRRGAPVRQRAVAMFGKLGVWDTEHNNGVLIYLLLAEHAIEIVADRGLQQHVDAARWEAVVAPMRAHFQAGRFESGLMQAIDAVDALLLPHFAVRAGQANPDELPNAPYVG